jgi:peroxiredoxin
MSPATQTDPHPALYEPLPAGTLAPDFTLPRSPDAQLRLSDLHGRPVILVFYPADWSPVCGDEVSLFNEILPEFQRHGAELIGISVDGVWCHQAFAQARNLRFRCSPTSSRRGRCRAITMPFTPTAAFPRGRCSSSMRTA